MDIILRATAETESSVMENSSKLKIDQMDSSAQYYHVTSSVCSSAHNLYLFSTK